MGVRRALLPAGLLVLLAGCSGPGAGRGNQPHVLPALHELPASAPTEAAARDVGTPAGAEQFVRFWYSEITRAWAARDPQVVARLSAPGCQVCRRYIDSMTEARTKGQVLSPVTFELTLVESEAVDAGVARVSVIYDGPAITRTDADGREVTLEPAVKGAQTDVELVRHGRSWLVRA